MATRSRSKRQESADPATGDVAEEVDTETVEDDDGPEEFDDSLDEQDVEADYDEDQLAADELGSEELEDPEEELDEDLDDAVRAVASAAVELDDDTERTTDDEEIEGLRDGEFVCRSCFLAKRESQLADPDRLLCRDCA